MENRVKAQFEAIRTYRLILDTVLNLYLLKNWYVPSLSKNLVFLRKLNKTKYSFNFCNG